MSIVNNHFRNKQRTTNKDMSTTNHYELQFEFDESWLNTPIELRDQPKAKAPQTDHPLIPLSARLRPRAASAGVPPRG